MPPRWQLTEHALRRGAYALRCTVDEAEDRLCTLMPRATYRATDRAQRELWRSPKGDGAVRWVVDVHADPPRVVWVGQAAPPAEHWDPAPEDAGVRGDVRMEIVLDAGAAALLRELRGEGHTAKPPGDVIGRALRLLHESERGRR